MLKDKTKRKAYLRANKPQRKKGTAAVLGRFLTDVMFRAPIVRIVEARGSSPTWVYRFAWASPSMGWAVHCIDVPFWFDCLDSEKVDFLAGDNPPQSLADEVHGAAVALVKDGDPGWPAWSDSAGSTRVFDVDPATPATIMDGYDEVRALV